MRAAPEHNHAWGFDKRTGKTTCGAACPAYTGAADALDVVNPGRVPPRDCIRAARDALTRAYGVSDSRMAWPFMLEALDWQRRGLEQIADLIGSEAP
jgi:hypothetical protein